MTQSTTSHPLRLWIRSESWVFRHEQIEKILEAIAAVKSGRTVHLSVDNSKPNNRQKSYKRGGLVFVIQGYSYRPTKQQVETIEAAATKALMGVQSEAQVGVRGLNPWIVEF